MTRGWRSCVRARRGLVRGGLAAALLAGSTPVSAAAAAPAQSGAEVEREDAATVEPGPSPEASAVAAEAEAEAEASAAAGVHEVAIRTVAREASPAGPDVVFRVDGGMVRGTVLAIDHGRSVTVLPAYAAEPQTIPWAEVAEVERGEVVGGAEVADGSTELTFGALRPWVHVETDRDVPVSLFEITGGAVAGRYRGYTFELRCQAPCDQEVEVDSRVFFVGGKSMPSSRGFRIEVPQTPGERVDLKVRTGRIGLLIGGALAASLSPAFLAPGGVAFGIGVSGECSTDADCERLRRATTIGAGLLAAGVALAVGGIVMALRGRTKVEQRRRASAGVGEDAL